MRDRAKLRARDAVRNAVWRGIIVKPQQCQACFKITPARLLSGHHHNGYENRLDVVWLCHICHAAEHSLVVWKEPR